MARRVETKVKPNTVEVPPLEPKVAYLRIQKKVYALQEIDSPDVDINKQLEEYYEKLWKKHKDSVENIIVGDVQNEVNRERDRIRARLNRHSVTVRPQDYDKPVMYWRGKYLKCVVIMYGPTEIKTNLLYMNNHHVNIPAGDMGDKIRSYDPNRSILISLEAPWRFPMVVGLCEQENRIYLPQATNFHTMRDRALCTGSTPATDFFTDNIQALEARMNRINMFSLARSEEVDHLNRSYSISDILALSPRITRVRQSAGSEWSV